jgi:hypothetical protein
MYVSMEIEDLWLFYIMFQRLPTTKGKYILLYTYVNTIRSGEWMHS